MADDNDNTCNEIEQAPSKPKRKSTAAYRDPGAIANASGSIVGVFQRSPVSSLIVTAILAVGVTFADASAYHIFRRGRRTSRPRCGANRYDGQWRRSRGGATSAPSREASTMPSASPAERFPPEGMLRRLRAGP